MVTSGFHIGGINPAGTYRGQACKPRQPQDETNPIMFAVILDCSLRGQQSCLHHTRCSQMHKMGLLNGSFVLFLNFLNIFNILFGGVCLVFFFFNSVRHRHDVLMDLSTMIPGAEMKFSYKSIISWQFKMCLFLRTSFTCIKVHLLFYGSCSVTYSPLTVLSFLTGTSLLSEIIYSHHQILSPHCCTFSRWSANILNSMGFGIGHYGVNTLPQ